MQSSNLISYSEPIGDRSLQSKLAYCSVHVRRSIYANNVCFEITRVFKRVAYTRVIYFTRQTLTNIDSFWLFSHYFLQEHDWCAISKRKEKRVKKYKVYSMSHAHIT